jgi:hypothetical protein
MTTPRRLGIYACPKVPGETAIWNIKYNINNIKINIDNIKLK